MRNVAHAHFDGECERYKEQDGLRSLKSHDRLVRLLGRLFQRRQVIHHIHEMLLFLPLAVCCNPSKKRKTKSDYHVQRFRHKFTR